jgi:hypothetical protein
MLAIDGRQVRSIAGGVARVGKGDDLSALAEDWKLTQVWKRSWQLPLDATQPPQRGLECDGDIDWKHPVDAAKRPREPGNRLAGVGVEKEVVDRVGKGKQDGVGKPAD